MKVSIIIPVYLVEKYIEECLISAFNQTYKDIEYIIVDDASPDRSMSIVANLIERDYQEKDIKVIKHKVNRGLSAARNIGIKEASGDYLFFLDSDDILPEQSIELLVKALEDSDEDIIIGSYTTFSTINKNVNGTSLKNKNVFHDNDVLNSFLLGKWPEMVWNKLVKRDLCIEKHLFFPEGVVHEDNYWSFILAANASSILLCSDTTYLYRIRPQSITQNKSRKNFDSLLIVLNKIVSYSLKRDLFQKHPFLINYIINLLYYLYKEVVRAKESQGYIKSLRATVRLIFNGIPVEYRNSMSIASKMKFTLYITPTLVSKKYLQIILFLQKKICKQ